MVYNAKIKMSTIITKRVFDIITSSISIIVFLPLLLFISFIVKITSKGPVIYKQTRVGQNGKLFKIYKFRTMINNADKNNQFLTVDNDKRITKIGKTLRKTKLDELPQLFNVFNGTMSFVGPRPEVPKYVSLYNSEQAQILNLKPGITDYASIEYSDESKLLDECTNTEDIYINKILPNKITLNLKYAKNMSIFEDIKIIFLTILKIIKK